MDPAGAATRLQEASVASRQLCALWKSSKNAKVLHQKPPVAVSTGRVLEAVQRSNSLLPQLGTALLAASCAADIGVMQPQIRSLLRSLFEDRLPELLVSLLIWLQQRPSSLLLQQHEAAGASRGTLHSIGGMWIACLQCMATLTRLLLRCHNKVSGAAACALQLIQQADKKGEHGQGCASSCKPRCAAPPIQAVNCICLDNVIKH
jgi:hypothetical protein